MSAGASGASSGTLYVADALSHMYQKGNYAICFCGSGSWLLARPGIADHKNCPSCNRTYADLETHYTTEIPKLVQAEADAVAKHKVTVTAFPAIDPKPFKPSVYAMFKDVIHPARYADPTQWDLTATDKFGAAILNDDIEQVLTEYDGMYCKLTGAKTAYLDVIRKADPDEYIEKLIEQITQHRNA